LTIGGKWLQTLTEISSAITRVAVMFDPENTTWSAYFQAIEEIATSLGVRLSQAPVHNSSEIESAMDQIAHHSVDGLIVLPNPVTQLNLKLTLTLAVQHRLPAIYPYWFYTEAGGLMSYGIDLPDIYRRAASYVDRILQGEKAGDLPIQQPTKFELVVNMKTAEALGLSVPQSLLSRADEVIE
jgi:putative ABC transport system substrate-binding protein